MSKEIPDFVKYLERGQMEIIPHTESFLKGGIFNRERVLYDCFDKLQHAMASGYDGMRVSGDVDWLKESDWSKFIEYEEEVNDVIGKHRVLALCTYPLHKYGASKLIEVERTHQFTLIKRKAGLVLISGSGTRQGEHAPWEREAIFNITSRMTSDVVYERDLQTGIATFYGDIDAHLGYEPGEYPRTMEGWREHVHPEDLARIESRSIDQLEPGVPHGIEYRMKKKDGTYLTWWDRIMVVKDEETGKPLKMVGTATDITELKKAEEKQKVIVATSLDGFQRANLEGKLLEVNDSYCQMVGYTREELLKMSISDVEAVESPEDTARHLQRIAEQGSDHFETRHKCKDGRIIDVEVNVNYLDLEQGEAFVSIRDITERKLAERSQNMLVWAASRRSLTQLQGRFIKGGFKELGDREIIELLLSLVLPARKAKKLAKECLKRFQNIREFLAASPPELEQIGITPACMFCIKLLHELPTEVLKRKIVAKPIYDSAEDIFNYLYYTMRDLNKEIFKVIYLDKRNHIIDTVDLFEGTTDSIPIRPREIVESAITHGAANLVFVHNHPSGDPAPSRSDKQLTRDLVFVGMILQIKVLDHIIIGENSYFSFANEGLLQKYEDSFLNLRIKRMAFSQPNRQYKNESVTGLYSRRCVKSSPGTG